MTPRTVRRLPAGPVLLVLVLLAFVGITLGAAVGEVPLPPGQVARAVLHRALPGIVPQPADQPLPASLGGGVMPGPDVGFTVWNLRLPRVLLAVLVGASLAVAGTALQGLIGNPLADPYTIGVSSGASVGAGLALFLGWETALHGWGLPLCAFGAALLTLVLVFALARAGGQLHTASFLLAGIVAGSFLWALTTLLLSLKTETQSRLLLFLMGRLSEADWRSVGVLAPFTLAGVVLFTLAGRGLDAMSFGEDTARSIGVDVERFKAGALALAALVTAATVAEAGVIGFVGLVVPHLARKLIGPGHRALIPASALLGALLTVAADLIARMARGNGEELPVGVVTALLGAPVFAYLLRRQFGR